MRFCLVVFFQSLLWGCFQEAPPSGPRQRSTVSPMPSPGESGPSDAKPNTQKAPPGQQTVYNAETPFFNSSLSLSPEKRKEMEDYVLQQQKLMNLENSYRLEESRNLQLLADLRTGQLSGCHLQDHVKSIEIRVTGFREDAQFLTRTSDPEFYSGFDSKLTWKLDLSETFGFEGEVVQSLFGDGEGRLVRSPEGLQVKMLQYVLIERSGFQYERYKKLERDWVLFNKEFYEYYESNRVRLEGLEILVTNTSEQTYTIYKRSNIAQTLASDQEVWSEDIRGSAEWGALMARTDCEDTQ